MSLQFGSTSLADIDTTDGPGLHIDTASMLPIDRAEAAAAEPFNPNPGNGASWWENIIAYGAGRFIDNGFTTTPRIGDYYPGGGAGQYGQTYFNRAGARGAAPIQAGMFGGIPTSLLLVGVAVVAFLALKK